MSPGAIRPVCWFSNARPADPDFTPAHVGNRQQSCEAIRASFMPVGALRLKPAPGFSGELFNRCRPWKKGVSFQSEGGVKASYLG